MKKTLFYRRKKLAVICLIFFTFIIFGTGCTTINKSPEPENTAQDFVVEPSLESVKAAELGVDYFQRWFLQKAENNQALDLSHVDLAQIEAMASSTSGVVVDTEELTIEVAGAIFSGNTAEIMLLVTANELESVWNDDEKKYFSNYHFEDESFGMQFYTLGERWCDLEDQRIYSEPPAANQADIYAIDSSLDPNQLLMHYWIITPEPMEMDIFSIPLQNFGRGGRRNDGKMVPLYENGWQVDIAVDPAADSSKTMTVNEEIQVGEYRFLVEDIQLTPLACTIHLTCQGDAAYIDEHADGIQQAIWDGKSKFMFQFVDGTYLIPDPMCVDANLCEDKYQREGDSFYNEYHILFRFDVPITIKDIELIELFEKKFSFQ